MSQAPDRPNGEAPEQSGPSIDRRKAIIGLVAALLLGGAALTGLGQIAHLGRLETAFKHADKPWLAPCVVGQLLAYLGYILAYHDAARADGGPRFDYQTTARIVVFGAGASVLGASVGGLAVDYWALRRTGTKAPVAARRVLGVGTIEWTILSICTCSAALIVLIFGFKAPLVMVLSWLVAVPACVSGALWFTSPSRASRYVKPVKRDVTADHGPMARRLIDLEFKLRQYLDNGIAGVIFVRHLLSHPPALCGWNHRLPHLLGRGHAHAGHHLLATDRAGDRAPPGIRRLHHALPSIPHTERDPDEKMSFRPA